MGCLDRNIKEAMLAHLVKHHAPMCRKWFADIEPLDLDGGMLTLLVRESVQLRYLQRCCIEQFREAAQAVTGRLIGVKFVGESGLEEVEPALLAPSAEGAEFAGQPRPYNGHSVAFDDEMLLSPDYSFENFVVGPGNRLAHAGAYAVAQKPGRAYNPFFIHAGVGLGKTHLLQAICQDAMRINPHMRIHYISCEKFVTQFHESVQAGLMSEFRLRFRNVDLLVVDDIHDLARKDRTQEEFFHTFNSLFQANKQIVLSSDAAPGEIPEMEERLVSRFNCGLVANIEKPSYETRFAILKSKASNRNLPMPDDVAGLIASRIDTNIRELEGAITKIQNMAAVNESAVTVELARLALGEHIAPDAENPTPTIQTILDAVTHFFDVRLSDLLSKRRHRSIVLPRQVGMWLARKHTRYSLEEIGNYFGGRDHATVMHAIKTIDSRLQSDTRLAGNIAIIEQRLAPPLSA
jgi:chromosomal replication initiator protein